MHSWLGDQTYYMSTLTVKSVQNYATESAIGQNMGRTIPESQLVGGVS